MVSQNLIVRFWITVNARNRAQNPLFCLLFFVYICSSWYNLIYTQHYSIFLFNCRLISYFFLFRLSQYIPMNRLQYYSCFTEFRYFIHPQWTLKVHIWILKLTTTTLVKIYHWWLTNQTEFNAHIFKKILNTNPDHFYVLYC